MTNKIIFVGISMYFNLLCEREKAFFLNQIAFKSENITMAISENEIKRDSRMQVRPRFITVVMNAYDDTAMK